MVHGLDDLNRLKDFGLIDNVVLIPHGVSSTVGIEKSIARQQLDISNNITVIASYGFLLPHKGLEQLIQAFRLIVDEKPDARLLMMNALYPNPISNDIFDKCNRLIKELHLEDQIVLDTTFHSDDVSILWLSAADLIVYPYQGTNESASGAVRQGLASHRPVAVTPLPIFSDVEEQVHTLPGETPSQIARGIKAIMSSPDACEKKSQMQEKWLREHSWENTSRRLAGLIEGLINHKSATAKLKNNNSNDLHQEHFL